jgi:hypothetical protein
MSRISKPLKRKSFFKHGAPYDAALSARLGPRDFIIHGQVPFKPIKMMDPNDVEIASRNRSGELRKTGKTLKDI